VEPSHGKAFARSSCSSGSECFAAAAHTAALTGQPLLRTGSHSKSAAESTGARFFSGVAATSAATSGCRTVSRTAAASLDEEYCHEDRGRRSFLEQGTLYDMLFIGFPNAQLTAGQEVTVTDNKH
jgi:hypothetical protein